MGKFEYFVVFESLLYGLALAHILVSISEMIANRKSIKLYWPHLALLTSGILVLPQRYYAGFKSTTYEMISSSWEFFFILLMPMSLYFIVAYLLFPSNIKGTDFKHFWWTNYKEIVTVFVALSIAIANRNLYSDFPEYEDWSEYAQDSRFLIFVCSILFMGTLGILAVLSNRKWIVKFLVIVTLVYMTFLMSIS